MARRSLTSGGRRKQQFVDTRQQLLFALTLFLYAIMSTILFLWVTLLPDSSLVGNPVGVSFLPLILQQFLGLCIQHSWSIFFVFLFLGACALIFSHQILVPYAGLRSPYRRSEIVLPSPFAVACGEPITSRVLASFWMTS